MNFLALFTFNYKFKIETILGGHLYQELDDLISEVEQFYISHRSMLHMSFLILQVRNRKMQNIARAIVLQFQAFLIKKVP